MDDKGIFYNDPVPYEFATNCLPTCNNVMRYYITHVKQKCDSSTVKRDLANVVLKMWEAGDGRPKTARHTILQFEKLSCLPKISDHTRNVPKM